MNATGSQGLTGITVNKSVEYSYEELAKATDDFSLANKIGEGGFGTVYYAELRGEVFNNWNFLFIYDPHCWTNDISFI